MGLMDKLRGEFIDIVEWLDDSRDTIVWRFPRYDNEIKMGAKLVVRESQTAVFVNEGQVADAFTPGTYTLETQNLPILSTLKGWKYGFNSPWKAEVYFVNTRLFTDMKWGTQNPVIVRDPEFGMVRLRAFGAYAVRVIDADQAAARARRHRPAVPHRGGAGVPAADDRQPARQRAGHRRHPDARPRRPAADDRQQIGAVAHRGPRRTSA